jgi:hypothetical protein
MTSCYALTAFHCLHGIDPGNDEVEISFAVGATLPGRVHRRSPEADLALIDIPKSDNSAAVPEVDRADVGATWRNPYRPSTRHVFLSGNVAAVPVTYRCEGGDVIEAMQLGCSQPLGDYAGYSGSPIERTGPDESQALLGVLLEQYPEQCADYRVPERASTVLLAATIAEVFRRFDCFHVSHLLKLLDLPSNEASTGSLTDGMPTREESSGAGKASEAPAHTADGSVKSRIVRADAILEALHEWQRRGLLDEQNVTALKLNVARNLIGDGMGDA